MSSPSAPPTLEALADRTERLYTLPAVALEVLRLTDEPTIDARALCDSLERDPALSAKLLRVVNSSLYGFSGEVASLPQAVAIVGVKPLKLLVLGFALPDDLFVGAPRAAMRSYWRETLTRSAAARAIAQAGWGRLGDEALVAGMMQGVGQLVLISQLGDDYAALVDRRNDQGLGATVPPLADLEREALGFEHRELSAELLRRWGLPDRMADAIERQIDGANLSRLEGGEACLAQSLRLANLTTRLVAGRALGVLPRLTEEGERYCGLSRPQINTIVEGLEAKAEQLADAMTVDLGQGYDYRQTLLEAHARMALVAEGAVGRLAGGRKSAEETDEDERLCRELLGETRRLSAVMREFLGSDEPDAARPAHVGRATPRRPHGMGRPGASDRLLSEVNRVAVECRSKRQPLSLTLATLDVDRAPNGVAPIETLRGWLGETGGAVELQTATWLPIGGDRFALVWPGVERQEASRLWNEAAAALGGLCLNAGVAGVASVPRGFDAEKLVEAAERCLEAATGVAGSAVKSIEVF